MEEIERRAGEFLADVPGWIWDGESIPVPIEDIADSHCGLLVCDVEDMTAAPGSPPVTQDQSLSGLLLPGRREIWVNAEETKRWPPRRRFTIGHELGHWVLHQREETAIFCRHGQVDAEPEGEPAPDRPPLDPIEEEANHFAAALLMPAHLIRREYERPDRDFSRLCTAFGSSGGAMGRRLHQVI